MTIRRGQDDDVDAAGVLIVDDHVGFRTVARALLQSDVSRSLVMRRTAVRCVARLRRLRSLAASRRAARRATGHPDL
jgi:hypothetical protein